MPSDPAAPGLATEAAASRWVLLVRPESGEYAAPFDVRIRRWIKAGLRGYGVRLVEATETTLDEQLRAARDEVLELREQVNRLTRKLKRIGLATC